MCISPDEMTTAELEQEIAGLHRWATDIEEKAPENPAGRKLVDYYKNRAQALEDLLKERAEEGNI